MRYGQKCKGGKCGVEKSGADRMGGKCRSGKCGSIGSRGGKCRSRLAVWKAEPILYSDTALRYFLKIVFRLLSEQRVILLHF